MLFHVDEAPETKQARKKPNLSPKWKHSAIP